MSVLKLKSAFLKLQNVFSQNAVSQAYKNAPKFFRLMQHE